MHVAIPSKGRPSTKVYKLLGDFNVTHFVEPQDADAYKAQGVPNVHILPSNNQGIAFVRNYIIKYHQAKGINWLWMMDDDITGYGIAKAGKTIKGDHTVLSDFHSRVQQYKFPINGINYCQYAWSYSTGKTRYMINRKPAEVCTLLYLPKITWQYRSRLNLKEDRDFCMQAIQHSSGILFDSHSWFNAPGVGSNAGGLQDLYKLSQDAEAAAKFVDQWKPWAKLIRKGDRIDAKLDLSGYAKSLNRQVK